MPDRLAHRSDRIIHRLTVVPAFWLLVLVFVGIATGYATVYAIFPWLIYVFIRAAVRTEPYDRHRSGDHPMSHDSAGS